MSVVSAVLDRIDTTMPEDKSNGLKISPTMITIILFFVGQILLGGSALLCAIWWASAINTKMDRLIVDQKDTSDIVRKEDPKVDNIDQRLRVVEEWKADTDHAIYLKLGDIKKQFPRSK